MDEAEEELTRRDAWIAAGLAVVVLLLGGVRMVPGIAGIYHDDGIYVSTAKALAEGQGYRLINLPGAPPQTKYPILWPAVLSLLWNVLPFPANVVLMQVVTLATGAALSALSYLYLVRWGYAGRATAFAAGLLCATSDTYLFFASIILTEMPFGLACVAAFWLLEKQLRQPATVRGQFWLGILLAVPVLIRSAGAPFVLAAMALLWRAKRPLPWTIAGVVVAVSPWAWFALGGAGGWQRDPVEGYYTDYAGWWQDAAAVNLLRVVQGNVIYSLWGSSRAVLGGLAQFATEALGVGPDQPDSKLNWDAIWLMPQLALGILVWLEVTRLAVKGRALPLLLAAYMALILVWPWPSLRFLTPLVPLLTAFGLKKLAQLNSPTAGVILVTLLVAANVVGLYRVAAIGARTGYYGDVADKNPATWEAVRELFDWVRDHSEKEDAVASLRDPLVYLHTGQPSFRPVVHRPLEMFYGFPGSGIGDAAEVSRILKLRRAKLLVDIPLPTFPEEKEFAKIIEELTVQNPPRLQLVFQARDPRMKVYKVLP